MRLFKINIFLILFISITACNREIESIGQEETSITPVFVTGLHPVDDLSFSSDISLKVIQGIAAFENGWFVTQKYGTSILLINYLDADGVSLFHKRLYINSHGQDLSWEQIDENTLYLYTSKGTFGGTRNTGMYRLIVTLSPKINNLRDWSQTNITVDTAYDLNYTNATPSLNEAKDRFVVRSLKTIHIHNKDEVETGNLIATTHFELNNAQLIDTNHLSLWFQGIAMKNNKIYCLTGNERIDGNKKIYVYEPSGIAIGKFTFDSTGIHQDLFDKMEPEGLTFIGNDLYFTIMTKSETEVGNVKFLYKVTF